jgi:DNA invertase Pin-like site-specific DNA recombinase
MRSAAENQGSPMSRIIIYLRVSTDEQAESGLGLEAQLAACSTVADRLGAPIAAIHQDELTGATPLDRRSGLMDAIAAVGRGDVLLVAKRDRLARGDALLTAMIEAAVRRRGGRILSAAGEGTDDDDPASILMRRMIDAFAEYERLIIAARTRAALHAKSARGERAGQVPYGSRLSGNGPHSRKRGLPTGLEPDPAEVATIDLMVELRAAGRSLRAIARELDRRGHRTKRGAPWRQSTVHDVLRRVNGHGQA